MVKREHQLQSNFCFRYIVNMYEKVIGYNLELSYVFGKWMVAVHKPTLLRIWTCDVCILTIWENFGGVKCSIFFKVKLWYVFVLYRKYDAFYEVTNKPNSIALHCLQLAGSLLPLVWCCAWGQPHLTHLCAIIAAPFILCMHRATGIWLCNTSKTRFAQCSHTSTSFKKRVLIFRVRKRLAFQRWAISIDY